METCAILSEKWLMQSVAVLPTSQKRFYETTVQVRSYTFMRVLNGCLKCRFHEVKTINDP